MLDMSLAKLGDALGVTLQQVQKYETGASTISASRHRPNPTGTGSIFLRRRHARVGRFETHDCFAQHRHGFHGDIGRVGAAKAFMKIRSMPVRRRIIELVEGIGGGRLH